MSDELLELPEGWEWTDVKSISSVITGKTPSTSNADFWDGGIPFVTPSQIDPSGSILPPNRTLTDLGAAQARIISENSTLAVCIGTVGKIGLLDRPSVINQQLNALTPNKNIHAKFLYYWSQYFLRSWIIENASATVNAAILNKSRLENAPVILPPLNEQRRIVAKIEELRERSQKARSHLSAIPNLCDKFRQSVLAAAFRGDLTADWREQNPDVEPASVLLERIRVQDIELPDSLALSELPEGWSWSNLGAVGKVSGGLTKNSKRDELPLEFPYLRVANVYANSLDLSEVKTIKIHEGEYKRVLLQEGDLLLVEGNGSIDQIGRVALWNGSIDPCLHQNHLIKVRFNPTEIGQYILLWLLSHQGRKYITRVASSTAGLHTLSLSKVSALPAPIASQCEQREIVKRIETLFQIVNRFEQEFNKSESQVNLLDRSILAKAFRGELVEQDPNDEPASVLLERIRAEREQQAQGKAKKPGKKGQRTIKTDPP